jgi:hypothetical protein
MPRGVAKAKDVGVDKEKSVVKKDGVKKDGVKKDVVKKDVVKRGRKMRGGDGTLFDKFCIEFLNNNRKNYNEGLEPIISELDNLHQNIKKVRGKQPFNTDLTAELNKVKKNKTYKFKIPDDLNDINNKEIYKFDDYSLDAQIKLILIMLKEIGDSYTTTREVIEKDKINPLLKKIIFNTICKFFYHLKNMCNLYPDIVGNIDLGDITDIKKTLHENDAVKEELAKVKAAKEEAEKKLAAANDAVKEELAKVKAAKEEAEKKLAAANDAKEKAEKELVAETAAKEKVKKDLDAAENEKSTNALSLKFAIINYFENQIAAIDYFKSNSDSNGDEQDKKIASKMRDALIDEYDDMKSYLDEIKSNVELKGKIEKITSYSLNGGGKRKINSSRTKRK